MFVFENLKLWLMQFLPAYCKVQYLHPSGLRSAEEESGRRWKRCEFSIANRDAIVSPDLRCMARRVLNYFSEANMTLQFSSAAKALFLGFCTCFSAKSAMLRDGGEDASAPRAATGAWHLAVLSGANLVFEISVGQARVQNWLLASFVHFHGLSSVCVSSWGRPAARQVDEQVAAQRNLQVEERHVLRAFDQVKLSHDLISTWARGAPCLQSPPVHPAEQAMSAAARLEAALAGQRLPVSQYEVFEPSQPPLEDQEQELKLLSQEDVPPLDEGYGRDGQSVQDPQLGPVKWSDRDFWLLRYCVGWAISDYSLQKLTRST